MFPPLGTKTREEYPSAKIVIRLFDNRMPCLAKNGITHPYEAHYTMRIQQNKRNTVPPSSSFRLTHHEKQINTDHPQFNAYLVFLRNEVKRCSNQEVTLDQIDDFVHSHEGHKGFQQFLSMRSDAPKLVVTPKAFRDVLKHNCLIAENQSFQTDITTTPESPREKIARYGTGVNAL